MKKLLLIIICISSSSQLFSQIPNNGFENWTNMGNYNNPDQWGTMNNMTAMFNVFTCTKGTPGNPGSSYLKLTAKTVGSMGIMPGIAVSGILDTANRTAKSGFTFTSRPESLKGKWQYMAYGSDQGYIAVLLSRWNSIQNQRDTIAYAYYPLPGMVMSWGGFTIPLAYSGGADPDSAIIIGSSSNANGAVTAVNSYLYLDDLHFDGQVTGIPAFSNAEPVMIYPNPADDYIYIDLPASVSFPVSVSVTDISGKMVISGTHSTGKTLRLDISQLSGGIYLLTLSSSTGTFTGKFQITR